MYKFSNQIESFLKNYLGDEKAQDRKMALIPRSAGKFRPGDLLVFRYIMPYSTLERGKDSPLVTVRKRGPYRQMVEKSYEHRQHRISVKARKLKPKGFRTAGGGGAANSRLVLIVRNHRTGLQGRGATFTSTKGNELLSCFRLETTSPEITSIIVDKLYKNVRAASYSRIVGSLSTILGSQNYRTYKVSQLSQIYKVNM